jgi:hypothetical protein
VIAGQLLERVYRAIHDDIVDGVATGGSATTLVDSTIASKFTENKFKNWIAFISSTTDGLSPQSRFAIISAFVNSTGTATFPTLTDAVGAGDTYSLAKGTIPLYTLLKLCNDGLRALGRFYRYDVSLTSSSSLTYTMPIATKGIRPRNIFLRDSDFYEQAAPSYEIIPAAGGSTETLVFKSKPTLDLTIVIEYLGAHPELTAYNSYVDEYIHDELALAACVERAYHWKMTPKNRKLDVQNWQLAKQALQEAKALYPIQRPIVHNQRVPVTLYNDLSTQ